ncbi:DEAD/DEAH box helicase [Maricaulis parjimensis]|uniref:DEAD/DEAH box helicase n=1 Tax=Maricaulis parjimensis TaxID=144023 RepID=UPI0019394983|nr:DEAD/DEAH box helicase [Maricaulis parjimensis]
MTQFSELGLADPILRALDDAGYNEPTPIQAETIPALLGGRDVLGIAQTGTGKTAAFVLPILHNLANLPKRPAPKTCRALILSPTRELSAQIRENLQNYSAHMRLSSALVVGGLKIGPQIKVVARGVDVIVATPGRLLDLVKQRALRLDEVKTLVLDEADQMLDLGFFPAIREVVSMIPQDRQTALLSATMPPQIKKLAEDLLTDPQRISVAPVSRPIERITQSAILTPKNAKKDLLLSVLGAKDMERAIVFTRTKRGADKVNKILVQYGLKSAAIHGDKTQGQRVKALQGFKDGSMKILVATDIAARGIDVDDVSHVVNYELPNIPESYVHRIGRTARAGKNGIAVSFCDPTEYEYLCDIERLTGIELDKGIVGEEEDFYAEAKNAVPAASKAKKPRNRRGPSNGQVSVKARGNSKPRNKDKGKPSWSKDSQPREERQQSEARGQREDRPQGERGARPGKPAHKSGGKPGGHKGGHRGGQKSGERHAHGQPGQGAGGHRPPRRQGRTRPAASNA